MFFFLSLSSVGTARHNIEIIIILFFWRFFTHYCNLSDSNSSQVSRSLLSILVNINNAVFGIVRSQLIPMSSNPFINPLVTVPCAPTTIRITITFMFLSLFFSVLKLGLCNYFSFHLKFSLWSTGAENSQGSLSLIFFFFFWQSLALVVWPRLGNLFVSIIIIIFCEFCHTNLNWCSFIGFRVTARSSLDNRDSFSDFQLFQSLFQGSPYRSKRSSYNLHHSYPYFPQPF